MQQHDPYGEKHRRHSNFRPEPGSAVPSSPLIGRLFFAVVGIAAAVVAYDRLKGRWDKVLDSPSVVSRQETPRQQNASPPPVAENEPAPPEQEEPAAEEMPVSASVSAPTPAAAPLPAPHEAGQPKPTEANKPEEPKFDIARYEMKITHGNSFMGLGEINGKTVSFLADTGASIVVVPERLALGLGLKRGRMMPVKTGGGVVANYTTVIDAITLGQIQLRNIEATINPAMQEDFVLLGMTALGMLEVQVGKDKLVLTHKQPHVSAAEMRTVEEEKFTRSVKDCASSKGNKFDKQTLDCLRGN